MGKSNLEVSAIGLGDDVKVPCDGFKILQTEDYYCVSIGKKNTARWFIPKRIRQGKINLYYYWHAALGPKQDDVRGPYHVFVWEKEKGQYWELDFENFREQ